MKKLLSLTLIALLSVGCGDDSASTDPNAASTPVDAQANSPKFPLGINLDDPEKLEKVIAEAVFDKQLKSKRIGVRIYYFPDEQTRYSGWVKIRRRSGPGRGEVGGLWKLEKGLKQYEIWWYENGNWFSELNYKNGKPHGRTTLWSESGFREEERNYRDGKKHGLWTWWDPTGLKVEKNYEDGVEVGLITAYNKDGTIHSS
ncbi:MAG: hypothetical protein HN531_02605, partial [Opitutae bacterium]|nr:hypothetical protein [Opitutae bacterium]